MQSPLEFCSTFQFVLLENGFCRNSLPLLQTNWTGKQCILNITFSPLQPRPISSRTVSSRVEQSCRNITILGSIYLAQKGWVHLIRYYFKLNFRSPHSVEQEYRNCYQIGRVKEDPSSQASVLGKDTKKNLRSYNAAKTRLLKKEQTSQGGGGSGQERHWYWKDEVGGFLRQDFYIFIQVGVD